MTDHIKTLVEKFTLELETEVLEQYKKVVALAIEKERYGRMPKDTKKLLADYKKLMKAIKKYIKLREVR
jgi:hypothetical protein